MSFHTRLKVRKAGGSLIATIPKDFVDKSGLRAGDEVAVTLETREDVLDQLVGSLPELSDYKFDRRELWGPDRY